MSTPDPVQNAKLKIPKSRHSLVFREIVSILKADPILSRTIKVWRVWDGIKPNHDKADASVGNVPSIKLTPTLGPQSWATNREHVGTLLVHVDLATEGTSVDDPLDIWDAIRRALFPADNAAAAVMRDRIASAGGESGNITLSQPAFDPSPDDKTSNLLLASGNLTVRVRVDT